MAQKKTTKKTTKKQPVEQQSKFRNELDGFMDFIREKGVIGLAVGIIIGTQITTLVRAIVDGLINPIIGIFLPESNDLANATLHIGSTVLAIGAVVSALIDFIVIAIVVYFGIRWLKLDKLEKKKD